MTARLSTDTVRISVIDGEVDETCEVDFPWLRPAVSRTYLTPQARLAHRWLRLRTSAFADDVRAGVRNGLVVLGGFGVTYAFVALTWGGWAPYLLGGTVGLVAGALAAVTVLTRIASRLNPTTPPARVEPTADVIDLGGHRSTREWWA